jgi:hypothetical protein
MTSPRSQVQGSPGEKKSEELPGKKPRRRVRFMDSSSTETRSRTSKTEETREHAGEEDYD